MKQLIFAFATLFSLGLHALEIDEKLTLRVLKTSDSRKTVLVNRGKEDGLVKGDHAKFYLSVGVVARGVAIKISPTRSVWSLYRLVNADYIRPDQVMKLKITAPVQITKDESRALVEDDTASALGVGDPRDLGIPLAPGAQDLPAAKAGTPPAFSGQASSAIKSDLDGAREIYGALAYESRSSQTTSENGNLDFGGTDTLMMMEAGFEYYFEDESKWYSRVSLLGSFRMTRARVLAYDGSEIGENSSFFGAGANWYPLTRPDKTYKLIPFGHFAYHMGSVSSDVLVQGGSSYEAELAGAATLITFGGGVKYFAHTGWGFGVKVEYQSRSDNFSEEEGSGLTWQKISSGPRLAASVRYRF